VGIDGYIVTELQVDISLVVDCEISVLVLVMLGFVSQREHKR